VGAYRATIDKTGKSSAERTRARCGLVKVGQRVRAFPPSSKSSMYQAYVTRVTPTPSGVRIDATLARIGPRAIRRSTSWKSSSNRDRISSFPTRRSSKKGDKHIVYVQQDGEYVATEVHTGIQGELTRRCSKACSRTRPSSPSAASFIDAEHKLKARA
jgi:hypothetical protein